MGKLNFVQSVSLKQQQSIKRWLIATSIALGLMLFMIMAVHTYYKDQLSELTKQKSSLNQRVKHLEPAMEEKKTLIDQEQSARKQIQAQLYATNNQENPGKYLHEVSRCIPAHAIVDSFTREAKKLVQIKGSAKSAQAVTQFLENLNRSKHFKDMKLNFVQPSRRDKTLRFMIEGKLIIPQKQFSESMPAAPTSFAHSILY